MKKKNSNRSFGILFFVVFLTISLWPLLKENDLRIWSFIISILFLILGILNSKILSPIKRVWIRFGELLGKIISPIVLAVVFFIVVTPIGLFMKILRKDLLNIKFTKDKSYWIKRDKDLGPMKNQF
jgi:hypothetical protein|tara:strand:+ start:414 stop:791 length:378 start_codon:yes stop_codon:yes gene_type:complete